MSLFEINLLLLIAVIDTGPSLITALRVLKRLPCVNIVTIIIIIY